MAMAIMAKSVPEVGLETEARGAVTGATGLVRPSERDDCMCVA